MRVVPYPHKKDFTVDNLKSWLTKFVKGELSEKETGFGEVIDADIKYMLQSTQQLKRAEFVHQVYEEEMDAIVLVYSTAAEDDT